jgi:hypothetical protein
MRKILFSIGLLALIASPFAVMADDSAKETITIRPATIALSVGAGEVTLQTVYFTNQSSQRKSFTVIRSDYSFDLKDNQTLEFTDPETTSDSVQPMLDFTPTNFELDAGQTQELLVRVKPDISTKTGQYKGALFIGQLQQGGGTDSIQVVGRVGTIIGVTVTGASSPAGTAQSPFSSHPSAIVIAVLLFITFMFLGISLAAIRAARIKKEQQFF